RRVMQHRGQAALAHIGADALDDARRRQRLAEHFLRKSAALRRHDVALRAQLFAQAAQRLAGSGLGETDAADVQLAHVGTRVRSERWKLVGQADYTGRSERLQETET